MKEFDAEAMFGALPSFYRDKLPAKDRVVLSSIWEGITRVIEDEYAALFQVAANSRLATSQVLSPRSWVYQEFGAWEIEESRHRHITCKVVSNLGSQPPIATYYLGRFLDLSKVRIYYNGLRLDTRKEFRLTNDQDHNQLAYAAQLAANPNVLPPIIAPRGTRLVFDIAYIIEPLNRSFAEQAEITEWVTKFLTEESIFIVESDSELYVSNPFSSDNIGNNVKQAFAFDEDVDLDTLKITATSITRDNVKTEFKFPIYPQPYTLTTNYLTLAAPLPGGTVIKVLSRGATQSITAVAALTAYKLPKAIDPDDASVSIFNINLDAIELTDGLATFGSPLADGVQLLIEGVLVTEHDHGRFSYVARSPSSTINLPQSRPLRFAPNSTDEDENFPIKVYINGVVLNPPADTDSSVYLNHYEFTDSSTITLVNGVSIKTGDQVEVEYVDEEDSADHVHTSAKAVVPTQADPPDVTLSRYIGDSSYPTFYERTDIGLVTAPNTKVVGSTVSVTSPRVQARAATIFVRSAAKSARFSTVIPPRIDESEHYKGTLVSAEALQNGIDSPSLISSGDGLIITPDPVSGATRIQTGIRIKSGWFKNAMIDDHLLSDVLGVPAGFEDSGEWTPEYRKVLVAFYAAMRSGSTIKTIRDLMSIVLGSEYAPAAGLNKGVTETPDGKFLSVETPAGLLNIPIDPNTPLDRPGRVVPAFHPVNRNCEILEGEAFASLKWLPFVAQTLGDYQYGRRLDAYRPVTVSLATPQLSIVGEAYSLSFSTDVSTYAIWPTDLIEVVTQDLNGIPRTVFLRPVAVSDSSATSATTITVQPIRYGVDEYGGYFGANTTSLSASSATLYTRTLRQRDMFSFSDIMLDDAIALAEGESVQKAVTTLGPILSKFLFAAKIAWNSNTNHRNINDAITLMTRAKPADTGVIPFTQVEDGSLTDTLRGEVITEQVLLRRIPLFSVSEQTYVDNAYVGPTATVDSSLAGIADGSWWQEVPQMNLTDDVVHGQYISSMVLGRSTWTFAAGAIFRAVLWSTETDEYSTYYTATSTVWDIASNTVNGVTTTVMTGDDTFDTRNVQVILTIVESASGIQFSHSFTINETTEDEYSLVSTEFPRFKVEAPGADSDLRFLNPTWSGYVLHDPINHEVAAVKHTAFSCPPALPFFAFYDVRLKRGMYLQLLDEDLLWKQYTIKGTGDYFEIFWTHYPENNFTPGEYIDSNPYTVPYGFVVRNLPINGPGESGYWDAAMMYKTWVESTAPAFLPSRWKADTDINDQAKLEKLFLVLNPSVGFATNGSQAPYVAKVQPAANFFPVLYEAIRTQQFFNDSNIRVHVYDWHKNVLDVPGRTNVLPPRPAPNIGLPYEQGRYDFSDVPGFLYSVNSNPTDNLSFVEMLGQLGYIYSGLSTSAPKIFPYLITPYWDSIESVDAEWASPFGSVLVKTTDADVTGGITPVTSYTFMGGSPTVDLTDPTLGYFLEKQLPDGGTRTLLSVANLTTANLIPGLADDVPLLSPGLIYGVDFGTAAGRSLFVDFVEKIYDYMATQVPSVGSATPVAPSGFYFDQFVGNGTTVDEVEDDCFVLSIDRRNAGGNHGNNGAFHEGKRTAADTLRTDLRALDPEFGISGEACEEALLGKVDIMHAIGDSAASASWGVSCYTFPVIYSQYQRLANLDLALDPSGAGSMLQSGMRVTNSAYHRGFPISWNISFSGYIYDSTFDVPKYTDRHFIDAGTAPMGSSGSPILDRDGRHIVRTGVTPNISFFGITLSWIKKLHSSMDFTAKYRSGNPLRPMVGSVDLARITSGLNDSYFYNTTIATQMQSIWQCAETGEIGIIITEAYPSRVGNFLIILDNQGWPLPSGTKYLYRNDGVSRVLVGTYTGNTIMYNAPITGQSVLLFEITTTQS